MSLKSFNELIRAHATEIKEQQFDWTPRKEWWQRTVALLSEQIELWLKDALDDGSLKLLRSDVSLSEQALGTYESLRTEIWMSANPTARIRFEPRATLIIGGFGRVDVEGPNGNARLIMSSEMKIEGEQPWENARWYIANASSKLLLNPLDEKSFQQLFLDLLGIAG